MHQSDTRVAREFARTAAIRPVAAVEDVLLLPGVQLALCLDLIVDEPFQFLRREGGGPGA